MITPTFGNVSIVIEDGADDLHGIADVLGLHAPDLDVKLAKMVDGGLLYRWPDNGVTRYGICQEKRRVA